MKTYQYLEIQESALTSSVVQVLNVYSDFSLDSDILI